MNQSLPSLYDAIVEHLDQEELRTLCFRLGHQYDDLRGKGRSGQARELLKLVQRQNQMDDLLSTLCETHPNVDWSQVSQGSAVALTVPRALKPHSPPKPFIGRKDERRELAHALRNERGSVIILAGLGGVGKTALAAQLAQDVADDFPGGILWLSLETRPQPETLLAQIAAAYGRPPSSIASSANTRAVLDQHAPLLILDNAESAPDTARALLDKRGAATILLITSDRLLGVSFTPQTVASLPPADALDMFQACTERPQNPTLAGELCALLGYMPLAINLAAGYINCYSASLGEYLALLQDSPLNETLHLDERRETSVLVTCDLTHNCLSDDARRVLAVLALDGGESSSLAAIVAGAGWRRKKRKVRRTRRACNELVRYSLVEHAQGRYRPHLLLRRYATEKLDEAQRARAQEQLTAYYLTFAEAHSEATSSNYDALQTEQDNILVAMERAYQAQRWGQVQRFARVLIKDGACGFLQVRGYWHELRVRLEQSVRANAGNRRAAAALASNMTILLGNIIDDSSPVYQEYQHMLTRLEKLDKRESMADNLFNLALLAQGMGEPDEARRLYHSSLEIEEEFGHEVGIAVVLHQLALLAQNLGEYDEARRLYHSSLEIVQEWDDKASSVAAIHNLGLLAQHTGAYDEARRLYRSSMEIVQELDDRAGIANSLHQLGCLAQHTGEYDEARRLYRSSLEIDEELGNKASIANTLHGLGTLARETGQRDEARRLHQTSLEMAEELEDKNLIAYNLGDLGRLAAEEGQPEQARKLFRQAMNMQQEMSEVVSASVWMFHLALLHEEQGRLDEALPLLERAVEVAERAGYYEAGRWRAALERVRGQV